MVEQYDNALNWLKQQDVEGCITGSIFLEINPEWQQDIDLFLYNEKSFTKLFYAMYHNSMFTILDKIELWKAESFMNKESFGNKHHTGIQTIKFMYNTCIPINIILKKNCNNIYSVLSSFDLDIICKGYDLKAKNYLDLTTTPGKIASWNKWNPAFQSTDLWNISRILRQLERCFKYYKRGYNTDSIVSKYIDMITGLQEYHSIFNSENFNEKLKITQENTLLIKQICELWLTTHEITNEQIALLQIKIKEI